MPGSFEGDLNAEGLRVAVVASRFNDEIVAGLLEGALDCLARHGVAVDDIDVYRVPGAFQLPLLANELAIPGDYDNPAESGGLLRARPLQLDFHPAQLTNARYP